MATNTEVDYAREKKGYINILLGLLVLTAVTFIQPQLFLVEHNFAIQMLIGLAKAWLILMYYMHLKGEKLIGATVIFSVFLVIFFFVVVLLDVANFQFGENSHITSEATSAGKSVADRHH